MRVRNPFAIRPWQHVFEPLKGYLLIAQNVNELPAQDLIFNFGPKIDDCISVKEILNISKKFINFEEEIDVCAKQQFEEAEYLSLSSGKASKLLGFSQNWTLTRTIDETFRFYKQMDKKIGVKNLAISQLEDFFNESV